MNDQSAVGKIDLIHDEEGNLRYTKVSGNSQSATLSHDAAAVIGAGISPATGNPEIKRRRDDAPIKGEGLRSFDVTSLDPKKFHIVFFDATRVDLEVLTEVRSEVKMEVILIPVMGGVDCLTKTVSADSIAAARRWLDEMEAGRE